MKKVKKVGVPWFGTIASLLLCVSTQANVKLGYVDVDKALLSTKEGQKVDGILKRAVGEKQKELEKKEVDIQKMTKDLEKKKSILSSDAFARKRQDIQEEMLRFQEFAGKSQVEIQKRRHELLKPLAAKMEKVVAEVAKAGGYTMIFRKSPQVILWASEQTNLTEKIVKEFEKKKEKTKK